MATSNKYFYAIGRRKSSTARVRVQGGNGKIVVNDKPAAEYFAASQMLLSELNKPFDVLQQENKFDITAVVTGGGHASQIDAIRLGIVKALVEMSPDLKSTLKRADLLSRDPREKERKKFGFKGARKQRQFTKR